MKGTITTVIFLFIGVITAIYIGFGFGTSEKPQAVDNELEGLHEKYVLSFSHIVAENTPKGMAASLFAQLVSEKTNGWVTVQVFPNGVLYNAQEEFDALKRNEIQLIAPAFSEITVHDPKWLVMDLPFLFENNNMVHHAFDSRLGDLLLESINDHDFKGLGFWDNGFKQLTNNVRTIRLPEDMKGLRVRMMPSSVLIDSYRLLGARAFTIDFNEVYDVLRKGSIDATENTFSNIYTKGFFLQQNYMTVSNHNYLGYSVLMNQDTWNSLPVDYQTKIEEAMKEVTDWLRVYAYNHNEEMLDNLARTELLEIHYLTKLELGLWRESLEPIYTKYAPIIGEEIMKEVTKLTETKE